ncbi:LuxR C-terminal-related transcriptional regulator [Mycobacterium sp.]|uniref:LuxR C-terminal-related transcriptional regulator n=1 Tax=Mycobacterium sp. TaxID=1785 RepID=UPI003D0F8615
MTTEGPGLRRPAMRVIVVSSIRLYRDGLAHMLSQLDDVADVMTCEDTQGFLDSRQIGSWAETDPLIVLLDMSVLSSSATARLIGRMMPTARIVALAVPETEPHVLACAEVGVVGYVTREGSMADLISVVRLAARGEARCSPVIVGGLLRRVAALSKDKDAHTMVRQLTSREMEIASHIAVGMSNRAIAARLSIELCTVKNHVHNILEKLGATRRGDIADCLRG